MGNITDTLNPVQIKSSTITLNDILTALSAGLAIIPLPGAAAASIPAKILSAAVQQAPGVAKALFAPGTLDSTVLQVNQIQAGLGKVVVSNTLLKEAFSPYMV